MKKRRLDLAHFRGCEPRIAGGVDHRHGGVDGADAAGEVEAAVDLERDWATYVEPNVWVEHRVS